MEKLAKFIELGLSQDTLEALERKGFEEPTPIQQKIIPRLLAENKDLVGQAQTGTGKTAAFGIPIIERIDTQARHTQALILTPTRELAIQVSEELNSLKGKRSLNIVPIYGGQSINLQLRQLHKGVDIVVGTPGRVMDHLKRGSLELSRISYLVLDEADEMLNMGFLEDVKVILSSTNPDRTTLLFSATMPQEIKAVAKQHMKNYELVAVESRQVTTDLTDQIYFEVSQRDKFEALCRIIDVEDEFYGLVFCRTKVDVDRITSRLQERGYDAEALHGDIAQAQREQILNRFRRKQVNILIATDVAARGIDINDLSHVINYAIPQDPDAYVHRIGRTGRAGKEGTAITFITPEEYRKLMAIKRVAKADIRRKSLPKVKEIIEAKRSRINREMLEVIRKEMPAAYLELAEELLEITTPEQALAALLHRLYQNELNPGNYQEINEKPKRAQQAPTRLFIALGKRDQLSKRLLVEFVSKKSGVEGREINGVEVYNNYSFITVRAEKADQIMHKLNSSRRDQRPLVTVASKSPKIHRNGNHAPYNRKSSRYKQSV